MYRAVTHDIEVSVEPLYDEERSMPPSNSYFWTYRVTIRNLGKAKVQLRSRYWRIVDARGDLREVRGPGVVGEEPVIEPGSSYTYQSIAPLKTPTGFMSGTYQMQNAKGSMIEVAIPSFSLDSPHVTHSIN